METSTKTSGLYTVGEPLLQVKDVSHRFENRFLALRDVSFLVNHIHRPDVTQGRAFSILGKSGSGKTTLASIISGLLKPTAGTVLLNSDAQPVREGEVGFVFQNYILFEHLTVKQNLLLSASQGMFRDHAGEGSLKNAGHRFHTWVFNKKILMEKADQYLDIFDLREHLDQYPRQLSGGQRQRLAILSQVLCSSRFIIFDEPFSGQDPEMKRKSCDLLIKTSRLSEFETIMIITHDIDCAVRVSDMLLLMGRQKGPDDKFLPGSTVFQPYKLMDHGLAWQEEEICRTPEFRGLVDEIKYDWFPKI